MKVYTSNYWKYRGDRGVQISCSKPDTAQPYKRLKSLMPTWGMVSKWNTVKDLPDNSIEKKIEWEKFTKAYWEMLVHVGMENILTMIADGDVLLCWCNKYRYCHRSILAEFLTRNGVEVEEI